MKSIILHRSLLFLLLATLALAGCGKSQPETASAAEPLRGVTLVAARAETVPDWGEAVGTVRAEHTSLLAAQTMGNILELRASEGDRVRRGQVLAIIDDAQASATLRQAEAALASTRQHVASAEADHRLASATLRRYQDLLEKKSVSPQEFDEVKARAEAAAAGLEAARAVTAQAQAEVARARTALSHTRIMAPFDGVISEKRADPGTLATPGMPIFVLEDTREFRLEASLDESDAGRVKTGDRVPVSIQALNLEMEGKVAQVVPAADPASRSFLVKVRLPDDPRLRSGLFGRVRFPRGERQAVLIPPSAVVERGQLQGVYVVGGDQVASLQYVTLGGQQDGSVEVLSGLQAGDRVVAEPGTQPIAGRRVEVQP